MWAGQIEKEGGGENPFRMYEDRPGFWDVRVCWHRFFPFLRPFGMGDVSVG